MEKEVVKVEHSVTEMAVQFLLTAAGEEIEGSQVRSICSGFEEIREHLSIESISDAEALQQALADEDVVLSLAVVAEAIRDAGTVVAIQSKYEA